MTPTSDRLISSALSSRLHKLRRLSGKERRLLLQAAIAVCAVRLSLWLLPTRIVFRRVRRMVDAASTRYAEAVAGTRTPWAVSVAARYIPQSACLTQALATQVLLARAGHASRLQLGVTKDTLGRLQAHAWVVCDGDVVIGGGVIEDYTALPELNQ